MVSFFGLKFGGEKKKKSDRAAAPDQWDRTDPNVLGEGQYFGQHSSGKGSADGRVQAAHAGGWANNSPYVLETQNLAASSMFDLSAADQRPSTSSGLKPFSSNVDLRTNFGDASSVRGATPPAFDVRPGTPSRPATSHGPRNRPWVSPVDVHFSRAADGVPAGPKSPLRQFETSVDRPEPMAQVIATNHIYGLSKAATFPPSPASPFHGAEPQPPPRLVSPSPPRSPVSAGLPSYSSRREPPNGIDGPAALPSPPMSPPGESEELLPWEETRPVIQNVAAKRDTLTIINQRRQSLSMTIEELEKSLVMEQELSQQVRGRGNSQSRIPLPVRRVGKGPDETRPHVENARPPMPFANRGPRPQSPAGPRGPMMGGPGPRPQSPATFRGPGMGEPSASRPHSPAAFRSPGLSEPPGPRPHSPAGMRGPRHQSPMGRRPGPGPQPWSPAGMRSPPNQIPTSRGPGGPHQESPMGHRPFDGPRPESPGVMRGPVPGSPMGRRPFDGPRPQNPPAARGPRPDGVPTGRDPLGMHGPIRPGPPPSVPIDRPPGFRRPPANRPPRPAPEEYCIVPRADRRVPQPATVEAGGLPTPAPTPSPAARPTPIIDVGFSFPFSPAPSPPPPPSEAETEEAQEHDDGASPANTARASPPPPPTVIVDVDASPSHLAPDASSDWPLPSPTARGGVRAAPPPPLNLNFTASMYAKEIGMGPWTPSPRSTMTLIEEDKPSVPAAAPDLLRPDSPGGRAPAEGTIGMARGPSIRVVPQKEVPVPVPTIPPHLQGQRRPDFGLRNPTGFTDDFGTSFI